MKRGTAKITGEQAHDAPTVDDRLAGEVEGALAAFRDVLSAAELARTRAVLAEQLRSDPVVRLLIAARAGRAAADSDIEPEIG